MSLISSDERVTDDVIRLRYMFTNVYLVGNGQGWVLIDAAMKGAGDDIVGAAEEYFGEGARPDAILLTHGHFDHVGAMEELLERWDVPVWAHQNELPHLTGRQDYVEPDPSVGKGAMALLSFAYPNAAIDLGDRVQALPDDSSVPHLPGWQWVFTPGHTNGHVSFFRESDRALIAGDAFVTVEQESLYKVATQKEEVHGPPAYFTPDWNAAYRSVRKLEALAPEIGATGHGTPMRGEALRSGLRHLVENWDEIAVPEHGKYVPE